MTWQTGTNCSEETVGNIQSRRDTLDENYADAGKSCEQVAVRLPIVKLIFRS